MAAQVSARPIDTRLKISSSPPDAPDEFESPSTSSSTALARFEFESGRKNDGTKVLLVEWEDDEVTRSRPGAWHVSWKDQSPTIPAGDKLNHNLHRLFFLLQPGTPIPPTIDLTHLPADASKEKVEWRTTPLPAIFPPELGATARVSGKKGVLHTLWAKKRLSVLQEEVDAESKYNAEGIALNLALQEKQWIEDNFGVLPKPTPLRRLSDVASEREALAPSTPKSPARFLEKMRGLKIATNDCDHTSDPPSPGSMQILLSPDTSDVAVSSFSAIRGVGSTPLNSLPAIKASVPPQDDLKSSQSASATGIGRPPQSTGSVSSLDSMISGSVARTGKDDESVDDGLFALPISPRSPEIAKGSPFSFDANDVNQLKESRLR